MSRGEYNDLELEARPARSNSARSIVLVACAVAIGFVLGTVVRSDSTSGERMSAIMSARSDANTGDFSLGQSGVCIPASGSNGLGYATIEVPRTGTISGVTLFYESGEMNHCAHGGSSCAGRWGGSGGLNVWVTRDINASTTSHILYPATGTAGYTSHNSWGFYALTGYTKDSDVVKLSGPSYSVTERELLRVYYGEPLFRPPSSDNSGVTCASIEITYTTSTMPVGMVQTSHTAEVSFVPSYACVELYAGGQLHHKTSGYLHGGFLNGHPKYFFPGENNYLFYSGRWKYGPLGTTGYWDCQSASENPFLCTASSGYETYFMPFSC